MKRRDILLLLAIGLFALPLTAADNAAAAGVWTATSVNSHSLPGASFTRMDGARECVQETMSGTLLLDSEGNWSALMTYRNRCKGDPAPKKGTEPSALMTGTFEVNGQSLVLSAEAQEPMRGAITGEEITVLINGLKDYAGQSATFTFKRARR